MIELTIKDGEMPENCYVCPVSDPACKLWEKMGDSYKVSRHKDCPLREKGQEMSERSDPWRAWSGQWRGPLIFGFNPPNKGLAIDRENKALLLFRIDPRQEVKSGDQWDPNDAYQYIGAIEFINNEAIDTFIRALEMLKEVPEYGGENGNKLLCGKK